jgi:hypothetical protein
MGGMGMEEEKVESDVSVSDVSDVPSPLPAESVSGADTQQVQHVDVQQIVDFMQFFPVWFSLALGLFLGYIAVRGLFDSWRS